MPFGVCSDAVRALSIVLAAALAGCTFGAGPVIGISRSGPSFGFQGGGGPGGRWFGVRGDVGLIVTGGDDGGAYLVAGGTGLVLANPDSSYTGGAIAGIAGTRGGMIYSAGAIGVRFNRPPIAEDCQGQGWAVSIGIRRTPGPRYELFVWPQYIAYDGSDC
jgi:hypothetical protein